MTRDSKTTLGRVAVGLTRPERGSLELAGIGDLSRLGNRAMRRVRPRLQMIFQNPYSAFNPRLRVGTSLDLNLRRIRPGDSAGDRAEQISDGLERVLLDPALGRRLPGELSGGQLQRVAIARALLAEPTVLVADEIVSAVDLPAQAQIMTLLAGVVADSRLSVLFISHDLSLVAGHCQDVAVMDAGRIVEHGPVEQVLRRPTSPVTRALLDAIPRLPLK